MTALVVRVQNLIASLRDREEGQTMAEYALILGLIAVFVILMIFFLGGEIKDIFERTGSSVQNAPDGL
jgi:Flp pilus assembly pilin Flp